MHMYIWYTCLRLHRCMYKGMYMYIYICINICMCIGICICVCIPARVYIHIYMYTYIYMLVFLRVCIHIYQKLPRAFPRSRGGLKGFLDLVAQMRWPTGSPCSAVPLWACDGFCLGAIVYDPTNNYIGVSRWFLFGCLAFFPRAPSV